jgi:hypothetical protein
LWILFLNGEGTVREQQKINEVEGGFGGMLFDHDRFGSAIAPTGDLDGDAITELAVGAWGVDDVPGGGPSPGPGAIWILFMNNDGTVRDELRIREDEAGFGGQFGTNDMFGAGVAGLGDLNGDGIGDVAVGAPRDSDGCGVDCGAVWILFLDGVATTCPGDLDGSGDVGFADLLALLNVWGPCPGCPEDLDGSGAVSFADLLALLDAWGPCP